LLLSDIINGFSLDNDDRYNEFQSDANESDNTANGRNKNLSAIISKKLTALNLSNYSVQMIRNRAEAMSCGGCHQNSNDAEIAPNVHWPKSGSFVHVDEKGAGSKGNLIRKI
jgi:formate dehydrogenase assembly factor FdhD